MVDTNRDPDYLHAIFPDRPFGPPRDKVEGGQWNAIYFLFGQAMFRAQAYEDALASFIVSAEARLPSSGKTPDEVWRLTLGGLQKEYGRYCLLEDSDRERMNRALKVRNSLAHNFYRRRMDLLETQQGRDQVIRELSHAGDLFQRARDAVYWNRSLLTGEPPL